MSDKPERKKIQYREIHPLNGRVLILRDPPKAASRGGLVLADVAQEPSFTGTILKVAPDLDQTMVGKRLLWGAGYGVVMPADVDKRERILVKWNPEAYGFVEDLERLETDEELAARVKVWQDEQNAIAAISAARAQVIA